MDMNNSVVITGTGIRYTGINSNGKNTIKIQSLH